MLAVFDRASQYENANSDLIMKLDSIPSFEIKSLIIMRKCGHTFTKALDLEKISRISEIYKIFIYLMEY